MASSPMTPAQKNKAPSFVTTSMKDPLQRQDARISMLEIQIQELIQENAALKHRLRLLEDAKDIESNTLLTNTKKLETSFVATVAEQNKEQESTYKKI